MANIFGDFRNRFAGKLGHFAWMTRSRWSQVGKVEVRHSFVETVGTRVAKSEVPKFSSGGSVVDGLLGLWVISGKSEFEEVNH